jgi:4,5-dihydroxyphthalate decarboxylase
VDTPDIKPLIPDSHNAAITHFRHTGIYPISHIVVLKDELLHAHPWLAEEVFTLFKAAKEHYLQRLHTNGQMEPHDKTMHAMQQIVGADPLPYGIAPNRKTLETFIQFNVEQQVIPHQVAVEDLFPDSVLTCV